VVHPTGDAEGNCYYPLCHPERSRGICSYTRPATEAKWFRSIDKDGKPVVEYGKYSTIWKKQRDGAWKAALDMGNSSLKPAGK
jgi:hypothetical protein